MGTSSAFPPELFPYIGYTINIRICQSNFRNFYHSEPKVDTRNAEHLPFRQISTRYPPQSFDAKYSFVSPTTVPDSSSNAMRFGMLIRPLKVSAMLHSSPRSTVAPRMDTAE